MKMRFEIAFGIKLECEHLTVIRDSWNYVCPTKKDKGKRKSISLHLHRINVNFISN